MRLSHFALYLQAFYAFFFSQKYNAFLVIFHNRSCIYAKKQSVLIQNFFHRTDCNSNADMHYPH